MFQKVFFVVALILLVMTACAPSSSPSKVVEQYLAALVAKDDVRAVNLSCIAWEESAKADGASFEGVEVTLEDAACSVISGDEQIADVSCSGRFLFRYAGGEEEEIGLDRRDYLVVLEGGDWRMCGYK